MASSLRPFLRQASATHHLPSLARGSRSFHHSLTRTALNESDRGRDTAELHKEVEDHKNDALSKQKRGDGHWKGELASQSEAALKADRGEIKASEESIKQMQKITEEMSKKQDH